MVPSRQIFYDLSGHIVCNKLVNIHGKPCPEPVRTVAEFIANRPALAHVPCEGIRLVGETLGRCFSTTTNPGMKLIKSLTTALHGFHESGMCVSGFDESNLVVSEKSPELLFHPTKSRKTETPQDLPPGVIATPGFIEIPDPGNLKFQDVSFHQSTPAGIQANYFDAHTFITKSLFQPQPKVPIPDNIRHLLKLMKSPESANMGPLISRHASVVPLGLRLGLVMTYIRYICHVMPYEDPAAEATVLGVIPYLDDWIERAKKNKLLELFFNHHRPRYHATAAGFLQFYYDVSTNRTRWFKHYGRYTPEEVELVMDVTYPDLVPMIQEALWKTNHLNKAHAI